MYNHVVFIYIHVVLYMVVTLHKVVEVHIASIKLMLIKYIKAKNGVLKMISNVSSAK